MKQYRSLDRPAWGHRPRQHALLLVPLAAGLAALLLCCLGLAQGVGSAVPGPVYGVSALRARLVRDPQRWLGRTVSVWGIAEDCLDSYGAAHDRCLAPRPRLEDAGGTAMAAPLLLIDAPASPFVALVRRIPALGGLLPAPQAPRWGVPASYRIQLRPPPTGTCDLTAPCYEALLLDATPGVSHER